MCRTIVITTTEECEAMLAILDAAKLAARVDNYARERAKPVRLMTCTCCGESYRGRQWWNQDCGYGLGDCCAEYCLQRTGGTSATGESETYGVCGIHFLIATQS